MSAPAATAMNGRDVAEARDRFHLGQWLGRALAVLLLAMLAHFLITNPKFEWDIVFSWFRAPRW